MRVQRIFVERPTIVLCMAMLAALVPAGCADVTVRKVPTPTQYVHWTDDMQRDADNIEGIRFYLPRPFVNVFESFPVRTDIYLASGVVSPDGKYVIISQVRGESGLGNYIANIDGQLSVPMSQVSDPNKVLAAAQAEVQKQNNAQAANQPPATKVPVGVQGPTIQPSQPASPSTAGQAVTGQNRQAVSNDNGAFAYQPLRGNFDLVYMPDFEEQYAISSRAGLGNANFQVNLGQGWSLQGYNALSDNSELNKRVFDLIDTSIKLAKAAAQTALGVPLPSIPNGIPGTAIAQAENQIPKETKAGTPVSLKIVVIHYAAKGLYPVIKPRELAERIKTSSTTYCVLDLFKLFPHIERGSDFDPTALTKNQQMLDNETGDSTVPRYPYQYVSFNTFRYMAIEVVQPGDPFQILYDKTGTQGDPGDRQKADMSNRLGGGGTIVQPRGSTSKGLSDDDVAKWNNSLQSHTPKYRYPAAGADYDEAMSVSGSGTSFTITLQAHGSPPDPKTNSGFEGKLRDFLLSAAGGYPASVAIKPGSDADIKWNVIADPNTNKPAFSQSDLDQWNASLKQKTPKYPTSGADFYEALSASGTGPVTVTLKKTGSPADPAKDTDFSGKLRAFLLSSSGGYPTGTSKPPDSVQFQWKITAAAGGGDAGGANDLITKWNAGIATKKPRYPSDSANCYEATSVSQTDNTITFHLIQHKQPDPLTPSGKEAFQKLLLSPAGGFPADATAPAAATQFQFVVDKSD